MMRPSRPRSRRRSSRRSWRRRRHRARHLRVDRGRAWCPSSGVIAESGERPGGRLEGAEQPARVRLPLAGGKRLAPRAGRRHGSRGRRAAGWREAFVERRRDARPPPPPSRSPTRRCRRAAPPPVARRRRRASRCADRAGAAARRRRRAGAGRRPRRAAPSPAVVAPTRRGRRPTSRGTSIPRSIPWRPSSRLVFCITF